MLTPEGTIPTPLVAILGRGAEAARAPRPRGPPQERSRHESCQPLRIPASRDDRAPPSRRAGSAEPGSRFLLRPARPVPRARRGPDACLRREDDLLAQLSHDVPAHEARRRKDGGRLLLPLEL